MMTVALEKILLAIVAGVAVILAGKLMLQRIDQYVCQNASVTHAQEIGCFKDGILK